MQSDEDGLYLPKHLAHWVKIAADILKYLSDFS